MYACVLGNHLHLVAECDSAEALPRGMASLGTSIAMRVNRITGHRGAVFQDRYFVRELRTPTEVARAVAYVVGNENHHGFEHRPPPLLAPPATWLLREGWKRVASTEEGIDLGRPRAVPGSRKDDRRSAAVPQGALATGHPGVQCPTSCGPRRRAGRLSAPVRNDSFERSSRGRQD